MSQITNQKQAILDELSKPGNHPTAPELLNKLKDRLPRTSRATIYRNLDQLVKKNQVNEMLIRGRKRFEMNNKEHDHFICTKCNKLTDIPKQTPEINVGVAESVNITGICNECRR